MDNEILYGDECCRSNHSCSLLSSSYAYDLFASDLSVLIVDVTCSDGSRKVGFRGVIESIVGSVLAAIHGF